MADTQKSEGDGESRATVIAALVANLGIAVTKFIAAALSGSAAMLAEGIHSSVDTLNQVCLLYGLKRAKKPADDQHPLGYGMEIYFWSFVVAVLIFAIGAGLSVYEGVHSIITGGAHSGESFPTIPLIVLGIAFAFEGYSWSVALKHFLKDRPGNGLWTDFKDMKDPSIFVVLLEDTAALLGILVAAAGLLLSFVTTHHVFDAGASIVIGIILAAVAVILAQEVRKLLIGEAARPEVIRATERALDRPEVTGVNEIRSMHLGPKEILLLASVDFEDSLSAREIEAIVTETHDRLTDTFPDVKRVYLEVQSRGGHNRTTRASETGLKS